MAEVQDNNPFANFTITDSVEMEKTQLIEDFLSPETATAKPEEVTKVEDNPKKEPKKEPAKKSPEELAAIKKAKEEAEKAKLEDVENILEGKDEEVLEEEEEEKIEPPKKGLKKEEKVDEEEGKDENNIFSSISKELFNSNIFTKSEDEDDIEITTPEQFLERFQMEKQRDAQRMIQNFIGQFGEDYQNAFHAIFESGVNPEEYFGIYNKIQNFAELDITQEANQEAIVKQGLADQGLEHEDITKKLERIKNSGDLEEEAQIFHKILIKKESQKLAQITEAKEKQLQQQTAYKQQYAQNVNTILQEKLKLKEFDGIPLNPKLAQELQDYLVRENWKTSSGETLTDFDKFILDLKKPENHALKVKFALLAKTLEKDPTLSTIKKSGITKETNKLFEELIVKKDKSPMKNNKPSVFQSL